MSDTTRTPPASEGTSSAGLAHERETAAAGVPEQRGALPHGLVAIIGHGAWYAS